MELILIPLLLLGVGAILWNSVVKVIFVFQLAHRAVSYGTYEGYWGDFFDECIEGQYSFVVALAFALAMFIILIPVVMISWFFQ